MEKQRILILDRERINWKLERMAYEIWEHNSEHTAVTLIGIESRGMAVAMNLAERLQKISPLKVEVLSMPINKKNPLELSSTLEQDLTGKNVILVDDVANSGRTLLYALRPVLAFLL